MTGCSGLFIKTKTTILDSKSVEVKSKGWLNFLHCFHSMLRKDEMIMLVLMMMVSRSKDIWGTVD